MKKKIVIRKAKDQNSFAFNVSVIGIDDEETEAKLLEKIKYQLRRTIDVMYYYERGDVYFSPIEQYDSLIEFCREHNFEVLAEEIVCTRAEQLKKLNSEIKAQRKNTGFECSLLSRKQKLQKHQKKCANVCIKAKKFLIADEMGLGKTIEAISVMCKVMEYNNDSRALIVVQSRTVGQWKNEILKFTNFKHADIEILGDDRKICPKRYVKYFARSRSDDNPCKFCDNRTECAAHSTIENIRLTQISEAKVLVTGYEMFKKYLPKLIGRFQVTVFDEATAFKNHGTEQSKAGMKYAAKLSKDDYLLLMSGTFIENGLQELYVPLRMVRPGLVGEWREFLDKYFVKDYFNNIVGYKNLKHGKAILKSCMIRRTKEFVWKNRPKYNEYVRECPLGKKQREMYSQICKAKLQEIEDIRRMKSINNAMAATVLSYLLQACDTMLAIDKDCKCKEHSSKIDMLLQMLEFEISKKSKVVIFSRFANLVIPYIVKALEKKFSPVLVVTGDTKNSDGVLKLFKNSKRHRILVCSDAIKYGINLQCANYVINFDMPWNPAIVAQRIARCYRIGQEKPVTAYNFMVPDTIEKYLFDMLASKRNLSDKMLGSKSEVDLKKLLEMI